jgi:serine/threonine protein kinase
VGEGVPDKCAAIIARAMAKDPKHRYASAEAMLVDLSAIPALG